MSAARRFPRGYSGIGDACPNLATFRGEAAVGLSLSHRLNLDTPLAVTFGFSQAGGKNTAVRVGVAGEF